MGTAEFNAIAGPEAFRAGPRITGRMAGVGALIIALFMLGFALISQYAFGLQPCELCVVQRWPWVAVLVLAIGAIATAHHKFAQAMLLLTIGLALFANTAIAGFHVGVEQGWWAGLASCSPALPTGGSIEELRAHLLAAPTVSCGDVTWSLLGISMAGYNMLISFGLGALMAIKAWQVQGEPVDQH
ncbi:MAG: disulfide bond formation protein B [Alphaproteobacteria bacterium]|nr:disulfide bond formation protein B [Alphaproteobacteria bacterium SS10]